MLPILSLDPSVKLPAITLPFPDRRLHPNAHKWSNEEDAFLQSVHGSIPLKEIAEKMGRTRGSIRGRITRLELRKKSQWTDEEIAQLVSLYERAGSDGVLGLTDFARSIGRDPKNVNRKARQLGLPTNPYRRIVECRKVRKNKYSNEEERRAAQSQHMRQWIKENGHPRGMSGKSHTDETRKRLASISAAAHLFLSDDEKVRRIKKALETRAERHGSMAPKIKRGSWNAGWREIGGKRNYYRSRWEANYARYLQWLKERKEIADWQHEPETFWFNAIKRGVCSYLPDFRVWEIGGSSRLHEVKGWMDQRSRTTLKRMAKYHPEEKIVLIDGRQYRSIRLKVMRLIAGWEDSARDAHE